MKSTLPLVFALLTTGDLPGAEDLLPPREGRQWTPGLEWSLENDSFQGNPFDLEASVTFRHVESHEERRIGMFHDSGKVWKFRFTGTRVGRWKFETHSADPELDGHRGEVTIEPRDDAFGFVTYSGNKWARMRGVDGALRAFVPQYVMYDGPDAFHRNPEKIDRDIQTFLVEHGFNGFHVPVFCRWFDLLQPRADRIQAKDPNPDRRTFEALELLITKVHAAGGVVHLWAWGDEQRTMTPRRWGLNRKVDRRLQRSIAARLGPLPGWTMGYGFDLWEWVNRDELTRWHQHLHQHFGWPHLLGARAQKNRLSQISEALDYWSYEQHRPDYAEYVKTIDRRPGRPSFSEDRFRIRKSRTYAAKDYTMEMTRRGLWHSTMAGGVANIWGNLIGPEGSVDTNRRGSFPYPKPHWIRTYSVFFRDRFFLDLERQPALTDGMGLKRRSRDFFIFYREEAASIRMDLAAMSRRQSAVAVDALAEYREILLGELSPQVHTWKAPYTSDWAIAVGKPVSVAATPPAFTNITATAGTGGPTGRGQTGGHGAMFADIDGDGRPDLYITMIFEQPMPDLFYRNLGQGRFVEEGRERGVADFDGGSHGACFADLDNDGDYDLFNGTTWDHPDHPSVNNLLRNDGTGRFEDVTGPDGLPPGRRWKTRAVLTFDMDGDGDLDLFCVTNAQGSADPAGERNEIYRNEGGLRFTPINSGDLFTAPCGQGATDTDFDGDGDVDVIAANRTGEVNILQNDGKGNFRRIRPGSIGIRHRARDGITMADVNTDGVLDMLLSGNDSGHLYLGRDGEEFVFSRTFADTDGYMGGFADLDHDGDLDLVFAGDDVSYLNDGSGGFTPGPRLSVSGLVDPRGIAFADIDNDGDLDFAVGCKRSGNQLFRNDLARGHWLKVKLVSPRGQAGAFGARVLVYSMEPGRRLLGLREARSNNGYLGQDDPVLHFGLGDANAVEVVVHFLGGVRITRKNVKANQVVLLDATTAE